MHTKREEPKQDKPLLLVVEDDVDLLSFIVSELEDDYQVIFATNGREGLRQAREYIPDLVVTDLMMPDLGGMELCTELKANQETSHIPLIMLTAKTSLGSQLEGLETGADDYITKPFHMALLEARIHNLLESRRMLRERFSQAFMLPDYAVSDNAMDQAFFGKLFTVLEASVSDPEFDATRFARKLNMSLSSLHRKVKALTGETPARLIWNMRLKKAAALLTSSPRRITEIAFEVGYSNSNHFGRQFKQRYGMTPREYRAAAASSDTP